MTEKKMALPELSDTLYLGFRVADDKYTVFGIHEWAVADSWDVVNVEGKFSCSCVLFRFKGECAHSKLISEDIKLVSNRFDSYHEYETAYRWKDSPAKSCIVAFNSKTKKNYIINPNVPNIGLFNLVWLFTQIDDVASIKKASGLLNANRIFEECVMSLDAKVKVHSLKSSKAPRVDVSSPSKDLPDFDSDVTVVDAVSTTMDASATDASSEEITEAVKTALVTVTPMWKKVKRPHPAEFYISTENWEELVYCILNDKNFLITGPSGSGKTQAVYKAADALERRLVPISCGAMSEPRTTLIGNTHFNKEKGTFFEMSRFVRAVKGEMGECVILLDEITRAERQAFNILLPLLDNQGYLALDEAEDAAVVRKHFCVTFGATANIGMEYTGTEAMDKALKDRFATVIDMDFPPSDAEVSVLTKRCPGLKRSNAIRLNKIAVKQRELTRFDSEFVEMISTRMLLEAGQKIAAGMSFENAVKFSIENHFSNDGGDASERAKIRQLVQKGEIVK